MHFNSRKTCPLITHSFCKLKSRAVIYCNRLRIASFGLSIKPCLLCCYIWERHSYLNSKSIRTAVYMWILHIRLDYKICSKNLVMNYNSFCNYKKSFSIAMLLYGKDRAILTRRVFGLLSM